MFFLTHLMETFHFQMFWIHYLKQWSLCYACFFSSLWKRNLITAIPPHMPLLVMLTLQIRQFDLFYCDCGMIVLFNTSYLTDSYIIFTVKIESVSKNTIFGLKMMVKSGLGKIFLKFLHALTMSFLLLNFDQKYEFSKKNNIVC